MPESAKSGSMGQQSCNAGASDLHHSPALVGRSEMREIPMQLAGIFPTNAARRALHRALAVERVGLRHHLDKMSFWQFSGECRDVLLRTRRSDRVAIS